MKKYPGLGVLMCALVFLIFTGCENSAENISGTVANFAQMFAGMASDSESFNGTSASALATGYRIAASTATDPVPDSNGWVDISVSYAGTSIEVQFRFLDDQGAPITAATLAELYTAADLSALTMEFKEDASGPYGGTFTCDLDFTRNSVGVKGGKVSGTASATGPLGGSASATYTELEGKGDGSGIIVGGSLSVTYTSPRGKEWLLNLSYNSDGTAEGTIEGPVYKGTIHLEPNGSGSYTDTDDNEQHDLTAPQTAI